MRSDFVAQLIIEMEANPDIIFLTGDLGFHALEPLKEKFGSRFINVGIAEANMVGVAAGLALAGKKVITYSIASFMTMRCYEQIRTDVAYHNLDVKFIGVGGGYSYGDQGVTHHTIEDIAIMRALPNVKVVCPGYSWETTEATKALLRDTGPVYLRLGKKIPPTFAVPTGPFELGKGFILRTGTENDTKKADGLLVCAGNVVHTAIEAADILSAQGISLCVISMPSIKPLDTALLIESTTNVRGVFTLEENSVIGGLGSAVAETLLASDAPKTKFHAFGLPDKFIKTVGSREFLSASIGIDAASIARTIAEILK